MRLTPVNKETEIQGSEFSYRGTKFLIARSGNVKFQKMFRDQIKPYKNEFDNGRMDEKTAEDIMLSCFANTILVGWDKLVDVDRKEWEYSVQNAETLIRDDKDAYDAMSRFSEDIENYIIASGEVLAEK